MNNRKIIQKAKKSVVYNMFGERRCIVVRHKPEDKVRNDSWYWIKPDPYNFEQDGYMFTVLIEKPHYIQHTVKEVIEKFNGKEFKIIPNFIEPKHLTELEKLYKKGNKMELSEEELQRVYELEEQNKSTF